MSTVLFMCDDPRVHSGFGYTCRLTVDRLKERGFDFTIPAYNNYSQDHGEYLGNPIVPNPLATTSSDLGTQIYGDEGYFWDVYRSRHHDGILVHNDLHRFPWMRTVADSVRSRSLWWIPLDGRAIDASYRNDVEMLPHIAVTSHHAKSILGIPRIRVIPHAIAEHSFDRASEPERTEVFTVFRIDRHQSRKMWPSALQAFALFAEGKDDVQMVAKCDPDDPSGRDPETGERVSLVDIVRHLGISHKVEFASGYYDQDGLDSLWSRATAFMTTSGSEGFGLGPAEAMARGVPVIAPLHTVFPEILGPRALYAPVIGQVFDPSMVATYDVVDPSDLAERLEELYSEWKGRKRALEARGAALRSRALDTIHPGRVYRLLGDFLEGVCERKSSAYYLELDWTDDPSEMRLGDTTEHTFGQMPQSNGSFMKVIEEDIPCETMLDVIIVSKTASGEQLTKCLSTLKDSISECPDTVRVIVVDANEDREKVAHAIAASGIQCARTNVDHYLSSPGMARNAGFWYSSSPWVAFVDDDCTFLDFKRDGLPWPESVVRDLAAEWPRSCAAGACHMVSNAVQLKDPRFGPLHFASGFFCVFKRSVLAGICPNPSPYGGPWNPWYSEDGKWRCEDMDLGLRLQELGYVPMDLGSELPIHHPDPSSKPEWKDRLPLISQASETMVADWWRRKPVHSIVIPSHESIDLVEKCLASIFNRPRETGNSFEVIIVDDGSSYEARCALRRLQATYERNLRVLMPPGRIGFAYACNLGASVARGEYVTFLNNDTEVTDNAWLSTRKKILESGFKIVGPAECFAKLGVVNDVPESIRSQLRDIEDGFAFADFCGLWCLTMKLTDFEQIGKLDEFITGFYFEDVDLSVRARRLWGKDSICNLGFTEIGITHLNQESARRFLGIKKEAIWYRSMAEIIRSWESTEIIEAADIVAKREPRVPILKRCPERKPVTGWSRLPLGTKGAGGFRLEPTDESMDHSGITGWCDFEDLYEFAIAGMLDGGKMVEIGTWFGRSACYAAKTVKRFGRIISVTGVDSYGMNESTNADHTILELARRFGGWQAIQDKCRENISRLGHDGAVEVIKNISVAQASKHEDSSLDFVFIDGDHSSEAVLADIAAWWPKVKPGGILAGHDYDRAEVADAVDSFFGADSRSLAVSAVSWGIRKDRANIRRMGRDEAFVEVTIATRDRPEHLSRAIRSVAQQSFRRWCLTIIDDGTVPIESSKAVMDAINEIRTKMGNDVRIVQGPRSGCPAVRQLSLDIADKELIMRLDDDEVMTPHVLMELTLAMERARANPIDNPNLVAVAPCILFHCSEAVSYDEVPPPITQSDFMSAAVVQQRTWPKAIHKMHPASHLHSAFLAVTKVIKEVGYRQDLSPVGFGEETFVTLGLAQRGCIFVRLDAIVFHDQCNTGGCRSLEYMEDVSKDMVILNAAVNGLAVEDTPKWRTSTTPALDRKIKVSVLHSKRSASNLSMALCSILFQDNENVEVDLDVILSRESEADMDDPSIAKMVHILEERGCKVRTFTAPPDRELAISKALHLSSTHLTLILSSGTVFNHQFMVDASKLTTSSKCGPGPCPMIVVDGLLPTEIVEISGWWNTGIEDGE